ncbi:MAG: TrbI/VirB10 family protein [Litorimonas sp.]
MQIRGKPPAAKRFDKRVLSALLGTSGLFILLAAGFALRSPNHDAEAPRELYNTTSKALPDGLSELPNSYNDVKPADDLGRILGPPLPGDIGAGLYGAPNEVPDDNPFRYQPPPSYGPVPSYDVPAAPTQAQGLSPRKSKLFFIVHDGDRGSAGAGAPGPSAGSGLADPGIAALATLFGQAGAFASPGQSQPFQPLGSQTTGSVGASNNPFSSSLSDSDIYNPHALEQPLSPFQVMAGTVIPASLVTGLNSDLPGQVIAQVTENVFDTAKGRHLLIPQGTRLLGRYDSDLKAGRSRALVVWTRLIRPDGSSLVIESLPGVDRSGQAGLSERVDRHGRSLFGAAILSSVISVASELGSDEEDRIADAIRDGGQRTVDQVGQRVVQRALSRKPTLTVRPGWRLGVIVNRDLVLAPYNHTRTYGG